MNEGEAFGELSFRIARSDEAGIVASLINLAYRGDASRTGWTTEADLLEGRRTDETEVRALIDADDSVILLCERNREIVGSVHLQRRGDGAYLGMFVVAPALQAGGIGKRFLDAAEDFVRSEWGARRVTMTVISVRAELIAYYERRGYRRTGILTPFPDVSLSTPLVAGLQFEELVKDLDQIDGLGL